MVRGINREVFRIRFHRSMAQRIALNPYTLIPPDEPLILIIDALWFNRERGTLKGYCCYTILVRPVSHTHAIVIDILLRRSSETRWVWERIINRLPRSLQKRVVALIADGCRGIAHLAHDRGWYFQWCHVHVKRKISELRGVRNLPGKSLRREATRYIYSFLETADTHEADQCLVRIASLFANPLCPHSIRTRLSAIVKRPHLFRAYRAVPRFNLPVTTNSAEYIHSRIRAFLAQSRGISSSRAMRLWLAIIHHECLIVSCRGYQETLPAEHRISLS